MSDTSPMDFHPRRRTIDVGSSKVRVESTGSGPDLLLIHGWPLNGRTWRNVVPRLAGFTCHVIDLPGTGGSPATASTPLTIAAHVDTVVGVIDQLNLRDVVIVAQDSGGMIARYVAEQRAAVVKALCLSGTEIPGHHPPLVSLFSAAAKVPGSPTLFRLLMSNRRISRTSLVFGGTVHDRSLLDGEMRANLLDPMLSDRAALASAMKMIRNFSAADVDRLADIHRHLTMPTLLVWGEDDPFFPVDKARAMADQFGGAVRFEVIPNAKLFVHEEYPERLAALIVEFVDQLGELAQS